MEGMSKRGQPGQKQGDEGRDYWGVREDIEVKNRRNGRRDMKNLGVMARGKEKE